MGSRTNAYRVPSWKPCRSAVVQPHNSLGLPRLSTPKTPNLSFQNAKQRYTRTFCQVTVHLKKTAFEGILKAQNLLGDYRYHHGIPLFARNTMFLNFENATNVYIIDFPARLRYSGQFTVHSTRTKQKGVYRCTVYSHDIPTYGEKVKVCLSWFYMTYFLSSRVRRYSSCR